MRSCGEDPDEILSEVLGLNDLVQVLMRRSGEDPADIL